MFINKMRGSSSQSFCSSSGQTWTVFVFKYRLIFKAMSNCLNYTLCRFKYCSFRSTKTKFISEVSGLPRNKI